MEQKKALEVINRTVQITQVFSSRIIFDRDLKNPSICANNNPANDSTERLYRYAQGSNRLIALTQSGGVSAANTTGMCMQKPGLSKKPAGTTNQ